MEYIESEFSDWNARASSWWTQYGGTLCRSLLIVITLVTMFTSVEAQVPASQASREALELQYKNCTNGYYTGPRPGRVRYTKDTWLWVVTPEFAKKYCMPAEFVSSELAGAEAIAFKVVEDQNEEICGWGDKVEVCGRAKDLRFEIYIKNSINLPKKRDLPLYNSVSLPSSFLITSTNADKRSAILSNEKYPKIGAKSVFESQQVGLVGIKNGKIAWPITTLYSQIYFRELYEGIDYMAFHGQTGMFSNPRMEKQGIQDFIISFDHLKDTKKSDGKDLKDLAHVITLPRSFSDKIRARDKAPGMGMEELGRRALGMPAQKP
jgi:hypothetical protein